MPVSSHSSIPGTYIFDVRRTPNQTDGDVTFFRSCVFWFGNTGCANTAAYLRLQYVHHFEHRQFRLIDHNCSKKARICSVPQVVVHITAT